MIVVSTRPCYQAHSPQPGARCDPSEDGVWAFEVQNSARVRNRDLRGLRAFLEDYPEAEARLLYRGSERLEIQGIRCEPCEAYLAGIRPEQPLR